MRRGSQGAAALGWAERPAGVRGCGEVPLIGRSVSGAGRSMCRDGASACMPGNLTKRERQDTASA